MNFNYEISENLSYVILLILAMIQPKLKINHLILNNLFLQSKKVKYKCAPKIKNEFKT
jgi:hypothetical protein